jgi:hypothetical protein
MSKATLRSIGSQVSGEPFPKPVVQAVWHKAVSIHRFDPDMIRKDQCGAWIVRSEYRKSSKYGWEIDHIIPVSKGGSDHILNLQALHWQNNRSKGNDWPEFRALVVGDELIFGNERVKRV